MKLLELFAGTRSVGKAFEKRGHKVFSVEWNRDFENIDLYDDILNVSSQQILDRFGRVCYAGSAGRVASENKYEGGK